MSEITRSTGFSPMASSNLAKTSSSVKSPWMKVTSGMLSIGRMSEAIRVPLSPITRLVTWDQPPGAAPRSTTVMPGRRMRSFSWISSSL
ncbi:hypothetical protein D3C78_1850630 [compost metagenome]